MKKSIEDLILYSLFLYALTAAISITMGEIFIVLALTLWAIDVFKNKKGFKQQFAFYIILPVSVFVIIHIFAAVFGIDPANSIKDAKKVYLILAFFVAANYINTVPKLKSTIHFFTAGAAFVGLYAIITSVIFRFIKGDGDFRAASFSGNHMHLGGMMMMAVIIIFCILLYMVNRKGYKNKGTVLYFAAFLLTFGGLILTYTRGSWLAAILGIAFSALLLDRRFFIAGVIIFILSIPVLKDTSVGIRVIETVTKLKSSSGAERLYMWKSGIEIIKDHPVLGVGTANVSKVYDQYRDVNAREKHQGHLHNNLIQIAVIDGIIGLAVFLWLFTVFWIRLAQNYFRNQSGYIKYISAGLLAVNISFFINGMFEYNFFSSQVVLIFWFLMGISGYIDKIEDKD